MKNELNEIFNNWKAEHPVFDEISLEEFISTYNKPYLSSGEGFYLDYLLYEFCNVLPTMIGLTLINMHTEGFRLLIRGKNRLDGSYIVYENYVDQLPFKDVDSLVRFFETLKEKYNNK